MTVPVVAVSGSEGTKNGRPLKFATAEELECRVKGYFDECDRRKIRGSGRTMRSSSRIEKGLARTAGEGNGRVGVSSSAGK